MKPVQHQWFDIRDEAAGRSWARRFGLALILVATAFALSSAPVHARGGSGGAGGAGGGAGAAMGAPQGGAMVPGGTSGAAQGSTYRHEYQHQERHRYRYGDGSAGLVQGRPDCGLGGPCQTGMPVERPKLDYGHRE